MIDELIAAIDSFGEANKIRFIQVNLPQNKKAYESGTGEGVWARVHQDVTEAYENNELGTYYAGMLDNSSVEYPKLKVGKAILLEMRGECRPVVPYEWLAKYKEVKK